MFCSRCGKEVPNDVKFCIHCGSKIEESTKVEVILNKFENKELVPEGTNSLPENENMENTCFRNLQENAGQEVKNEFKENIETNVFEENTTQQTTEINGIRQSGNWFNSFNSKQKIVNGGLLAVVIICIIMGALQYIEGIKQEQMNSEYLEAQKQMREAITGKDDDTNLVGKFNEDVYIDSKYLGYWENDVPGMGGLNLWLTKEKNTYYAKVDASTPSVAIGTDRMELSKQGDVFVGYFEEDGWNGPGEVRLYITDDYRNDPNVYMDINYYQILDAVNNMQCSDIRLTHEEPPKADEFSAEDFYGMTLIDLELIYGDKYTIELGVNGSLDIVYDEKQVPYRFLFYEFDYASMTPYYDRPVDAVELSENGFVCNNNISPKMTGNQIMDYLTKQQSVYKINDMNGLYEVVFNTKKNEGEIYTVLQSMDVGPQYMYIEFNYY